MKLDNSSHLSDEFIREVIRFCKPADVSNFDFIVKGWKRLYSGTARMTIATRTIRINPLVIVRINSDESKYPRRTVKGRYAAYLPYLLLSSEEAFVHVTAHELRHLWQYKHKKGWRVFGAKPGLSERDADAYAIRKVRKWRKETRS